MKYNDADGIILLNQSNNIHNNTKHFINYNDQYISNLADRINPSKNTINTSQPTTYIINRSDYILKNIGNIRYNQFITQNNNSNMHYITINSSINSLIGESHFVQFYLYRIKLNVTLSHIINVDRNNNKEVSNLNIPSEFIDISIPKFNDLCLAKFRKKIYNGGLINNFFSKLSFNNGTKKNILIYNIHYLIEDLNIVLFGQNSSIPWIDPKYDKRIKRLILLSFIFFIKNSLTSRPNTFNVMKDYLNSTRFYLKTICINLYSYYCKENKPDFINATNILPDNPVIENRFDNTKMIKTCISSFIDNNENNILFDKNIIKNFNENIKYFNINYNKATFTKFPPNFDINLIFGTALNDLLEFSFRNIIYDIQSTDDSYILINYYITKYNIIFDTDQIKNTYIKNTFRIENYKFIKNFSDLFNNIIDFMFINLENINYYDFETENISLRGGRIQSVGVSSSLIKKTNKTNNNSNINTNIKSNKGIINNFLKKIELNNSNINTNKEITNKYLKNFKLNNSNKEGMTKIELEIVKDSIRFNDVIMEDLNIKLEFQKNNISELPSGIYSDYDSNDFIFSEKNSINKNNNNIKIIKKELMTINKNIESSPDSNSYILTYINDLTPKEIKYLKQKMLIDKK